jgi:hypothetical protein
VVRRAAMVGEWSDVILGQLDPLLFVEGVEGENIACLRPFACGKGLIVLNAKKESTRED